MKQSDKLILSTILSLSIVSSGIGCINLKSVSADTTGAETSIVLSDNGTTVNGEAISTSSSSDVYEGAEIIYYKANQGSSYGAGSSTDEHTESEAAKNSVITITSPGTYRISGSLSNGQIAVDLGEDAVTDENAVVNLILDGVSINCDVAPGIIFYNVWESESTTTAGANVTIADNSVNTVNGSYVAKIYKTGTTKKLHKYDGAFYSKESMIVSGESENNGILNINAENEGLDSELHLTINGGIININSQDDGINTNEDNVSIFTMNNGSLYINAGNGSEGDGIDSNGYLYINGGTVISIANGTSPDGGLDSDCGTYINGGTIVALGIQTDEISSESAAPYMLLNYASVKQASELIRIVEKDGNEILSYLPEKSYQSVVISSPSLKFNTTYNVYSGGSISNASSTHNLYDIGGTYTGGTIQQFTSSLNGSGGQPGSGSIGFPSGNKPGVLENTTSESGTNDNSSFGNGPSNQTPPTPPTDSGTQQPPANNSNGSSNNEAVNGSTDFTITQSNRTFSGITNYDGNTNNSNTNQSDASTETSNENVTTSATTETTSTVSDTTTSTTAYVKKAKITKATRNTNGKKISLTLKKIKNVKGYQISYSTSKKFKSGTTKTKTVKSNKATLTKLNSNKTYYVKARAYKLVNGKKIYGKWSKIKKVV